LAALGAYHYDPSNHYPFSVCLTLPPPKVFRQLRFQHIVNDLNSLEILQRECIIPSFWLSPLIPAQWQHLLRLETEVDSGPTDVATHDFKVDSMMRGTLNGW
jgi:hypothetical protein